MCIRDRRGTGLTAGHMTRGTTHVDVDDFGAGGFGNPRAFRHPPDLATRELNDMGTNSCRLASQPRHWPAIDEVVACRHLGNDESGAKHCGKTSNCLLYTSPSPRDRTR